MVPPVPKRDPRAIADEIKTAARAIGFDLVGIAPAVTPTGVSHLHDWLQAGYAGEMGYIERRRDAYAHPARVLEAVRSIVLLGLNYQSAEPAGVVGEARVARYAWAERDYHDLIRERLRQLADVMHAAQPGSRTRGVVDTAPLLERDFARLAGLGWFGKNTMLINRRLGSWFFLAALLTDLELPPDEPHYTAHCGTCTRCLEACPTDAFPAPHVLDARKCISYLTIELRGRPIPEDLRPQMEGWAFGCDVCQDVCPWNRKAPKTSDPALQPAAGRQRVRLEEVLEMGDEQFLARYEGTPLARPGRDALLANTCIAAGNDGDVNVLPLLERAAADRSPLVRDAAEWARRRLLDRLRDTTVTSPTIGCSRPV